MRSALLGRKHDMLIGSRAIPKARRPDNVHDQPLPAGAGPGLGYHGLLELLMRHVAVPSIAEMAQAGARLGAIDTGGPTGRN